MSAATPAPVDEADLATDERRALYRQQLPLQQAQITQDEQTLATRRAERKRMILAATRPIDEHTRQGLLTYDEIAVLLGVSKSAVYKMARGGWDAPGLKAQGV